MRFGATIRPNDGNGRRNVEARVVKVDLSIDDIAHYPRNVVGGAYHQWRHKRENTGVVLCSHLLSEIEGICDDVIIMNSGKMVAQGTVAEVVGQSTLNDSQRDAIRIRVPPASIAQAQKVLEALPGVKRVTTTDITVGWLGVELADRTDPSTSLRMPSTAHGTNGSASEESLARNKVLDALIRADIPVRGFESTGGRLQDIFLQLTAESIG